MDKSLDNGLDILVLIKTIIIAIILSLLFILVGAFIIKIFNINADYVSIVNYIIKVASVFFSIVLMMRGVNNGWIKGIIVGIIFAICAYLIFSILSDKLYLSFSIINDMVICGATGSLTGIISSNIKKSE